MRVYTRFIWGSDYKTEDGWLFLHLAILKLGRHMQTRNLHLAVVVGEYYDPGAFWIYGSVVRCGTMY